MARRYAAALAQSLYPAPLRVEQSEWLARVRRLKGPEDIATAYTARLETLGILLASPDAAAAKRVVALSDARAACLDAFAEPIAAAPCKLTEFKNVATLDGVSFAYASYAFQTADGSILGGRTAIFERLDADHLRVLFVPENDGGIFYTSTVIRTGGGILLHLPGTESGTGNFNRERLFVWSDRHWRDVDATSWLDVLARRLPKGLRALKGIYPDYRTMKASTPLWRRADSNASPTGGSARLRLALRGDKIVLQSVSLRHAHAE